MKDIKEIVKENFGEYKEGFFQTIQHCPKCNLHNVESYIPFSSTHEWIVWYDCNECGYEFEGEIRGEYIVGCELTSEGKEIIKNIFLKNF